MLIKSCIYLQGFQFTLKLEASTLDGLPRVVEKLDNVNSSRFVEGEAHYGFLSVKSVTRVVTPSRIYLSNECSLVPLMSLMFGLQDTSLLEDLVKSKAAKTKKWKEEILATSTRLAQEVTQHGDIVIVNMLDVYRNLPMKLLLCHRWLDGEHRPGFVMKTDDDVYVNVTNILSGITKMDVNKPVWWGSFRSNWQVNRHGKWQEDQYTDEIYPDFACGSGNIVSAPVHAILKRNMDSFKIFQGEDVSMGIWLSPLDVTYIDDPRWRCDKTCSRNFMTLPELDVAGLQWYRNNSLMCSDPCQPC